MTTDTYSCNELGAVSVVIATLGGDTLKATIEALNRGSVVPDEILICIPVNEAFRAQALSFPNVKVIVTDCRGQVAQRVIGFQNVSHDFVMQIDDDILVDMRCIEYLLETLKSSGNKVAVAPAFMELETGESVYKRSARNTFMQKIYYWITNGSDGFQLGKVDKTGSWTGIDPQVESKQIFDVECLAGGCVMHFRNNLILEDYYPFKGKAYFEDVVHSFWLRKKGVDLKVDSRARCWLESVDSSNFGHAAFVKHLVSDYKDRKYVVRLYSGSLLRMHLYYLIRYLIYFFK